MNVNDWTPWFTTNSGAFFLMFQFAQMGAALLFKVGVVSCVFAAARVIHAFARYIDRKGYCDEP